MSAAAVAAELVGLVIDLAQDASEHEREQIRQQLADAEAGLRAIAPNGPRIRKLVEDRRAARSGGDPR